MKHSQNIAAAIKTLEIAHAHLLGALALVRSHQEGGEGWSYAVARAESQIDNAASGVKDAFECLVGEHGR